MIPANRTARVWSRRHRRDDDVVAAAQREYEALTAEDPPSKGVTPYEAAKAHARVTRTLAGETDLRTSNIGNATHTTFVASNDVYGWNSRG